MFLSRFGIEWYKPGPETDPPVDPADWEASFDDDGVDWIPATVLGGVPSWLVAGPRAELPVGSEATVLPDRNTIQPRIRFADDPSLVVRGTGFPTAERPPQIILT
jgi:hypothetical protein